MPNAKEKIPALRYGWKIYPDSLAGVGYMTETNRYFFVDGDRTADGGGSSWEDAYSTIQGAVNAATAGDVIFIAGRSIGATATDPVSYAETIIIPNDKAQLSLIGVSRGLTQGGLPQIKIGAGSTAMIDVRAPGCYIANLGINGASSTGGGIKLSDNGTTQVAFGTTIENCHFKNCQASGKASTGGAITNLGGAWQLRVSRCRFFKCRAGIVLGAVYAVPQDVIIEACDFGGSEVSSTTTDADIFTGAVLGLSINGCNFLTPDVPAYSSGDADRYIYLGAGAIGMVSGCNFACLVNPAATEVTFGAAGTAGIIPTTVRIANCWGETSSTTERGWVNRV
jgi:hypothetical protein